MVVLEVIAADLADALAADQYGADRMELVTGMMEGGLTPSYGLVKEVLAAVKIPVFVMVRPHSRSFVYGPEDVRTMLADIAMFRDLGAPGIVVGTLDEQRSIDRRTLELVLHAAEGMEVTFHRAFDEAADQLASLDVLLQYPQITRILTSGGEKSAWMATERLRQLVQRTEHTHLRIMAGSGLKVDDSLAAFLAETGVREVHFGSGVRVEDSWLKPLDREKIGWIKRMESSKR